MSLAPWQLEHFNRALQSFDEGRLGHAQLLIGAQGMGPLETALAIGKRLLCTVAQGIALPCGACRSCTLLAAGTHPDLHVITMTENEKTHTMRTGIVVEQLRDLGEDLQLSAQLGGPIVAIIHPAEAMNDNASNALLKSLEEPLDNRYVFLVTSEPSRISATIRSRCQRMEFRMPSHAEGLYWLQFQGIDAKVAQDALLAARGNPGLAMQWIQDDETLALRSQVRADLNDLQKDSNTVRKVSDRWQDHDRLDAILEFAADYALEQARDEPERAKALGDWFDRANKTRADLRTTLRKDLMIFELVARWKAI